MGFFDSLAAITFSVLSSPIFWITVLTVLILTSLILLYRRTKLWALEKLRYDRSFSTDGIFVGESLQLNEQLTNPTWFPLFAVSVDYFIPDGLTIDELICTKYTKITSLFFIPPFSAVHKKHTVTANKRSHYRLSTASIIYRKNEFLFESELDFYAYPDQYDGDSLMSAELLHSGNTISSRKYLEDPFFVSGIRPYRAGDPMRAINHKASVRSFRHGNRQLMCNNYDSSRNYDSMIFLDMTAYNGVHIKDEEQLERGLRYSCFLFCEALKNAGNVGFSTNCSRGSQPYVYIPCGTGDTHTKSILEAFAELNCYVKRDFSMTALVKKVMPDVRAGTDIYIITPQVDSELSSLIVRMERSGIGVNVIPLVAEKRR